jgi:CO/xanthine dehydrogenase Mo-binding subunit
MAHKHLGKDFLPHDVVAKVTGEAKYAEDFRAEGMVFARLLGSPYPHARIRAIDASAALAMPGVLGILTPDEVKNPTPPDTQILSAEPCYVGAPVLLLAAESETLAQDALEKVRIDWEVLPFHVDPLASLHPDRPDARADVNVSVKDIEPRLIKWTREDFESAPEGRMPMGRPGAEWIYGDVEAAFARCKLVLDEPFVHASNSHHSMEPRSAMAYWQNGKCILHVSSQSHTWIVQRLSEWIGVPPTDIVVVAEYCGGGFGSKGSAYPMQVLPALMSRKIGRPVMLRISRAEEYYSGSARNGFQGQVRLGFGADGRLLAADIYLVQESGAYIGFPDFRNAGEALSLMYQPEAMRWRGLPLMANTPLHTAQRGPGQNQLAHIVEPLLDKAARQLGIDRLEIRRRNAPQTGSPVGEKRRPMSSCYLKDALAQGAGIFGWDARKARSGQRNGSKVVGLGIGQAYHTAGSYGFDGLVRITPDGLLHIHTGVGNLGTFSHSGTARVAAEVLKVDWDRCIVERGDSRRHLPWNNGQFGSNTSFTMSRTNLVAANDALAKLQAIAAQRFGGAPADYDVDGLRVFRKGNPGAGMTYGEASQRAIALGGRFDGHEMPEDLNVLTKASVAALAGTGLIGVAKDTLPREGEVGTVAVGFIEIELDLETGKYRMLDYVGITDCGTVIHPAGIETQVKSGAVQGFGVAGLERVVYDPQNGLPASVGYYQAKPPTYGDIALSMKTAAVGLPEPMGALGAKGMGEPPLGAAGAALLCAISDALGGHTFNRTPVVADMILNHVAGRPQAHGPLQSNCQ